MWSDWFFFQDINEMKWKCIFSYNECADISFCKMTRTPLKVWNSCPRFKIVTFLSSSLPPLSVIIMKLIFPRMFTLNSLNFKLCRRSSSVRCRGSEGDLLKSHIIDQKEQKSNRWSEGGEDSATSVCKLTNFSGHNFMWYERTFFINKL